MDSAASVLNHVGRRGVEFLAGEMDLLKPDLIGNDRSQTRDRSAIEAVFIAMWLGRWALCVGRGNARKRFWEKSWVNRKSGVSRLQPKQAHSGLAVEAILC